MLLRLNAYATRIGISSRDATRVYLFSNCESATVSLFCNNYSGRFFYRALPRVARTDTHDSAIIERNRLPWAHRQLNGGNLTFRPISIYADNEFCLLS